MYVLLIELFSGIIYHARYDFVMLFITSIKNDIRINKPVTRFGYTALV